MNITRGIIAKAQKVVLYGPEGIGKSTLAAQFPNPLFIDTEGSTSNMDVARFDAPSSWTMLNQQIQYVKQNKPCQSVVIDTIDWAERMCIDHICQSNQKNSIEDFGYGAGYIKLEEELGKFLNLLSDLIECGINVVLTAHSQIRKFEQPDEMGAYDRYELKLGKKTSSRTSALVKEWADMVLFANYKTLSVASDSQSKKFKGQGGKRVIFTTHHPAWDAKNRFGLPDEIDMDFGQLAHIFNYHQPTQQVMNVPPEPTPSPFELTPEDKNIEYPFDTEEPSSNQEVVLNVPPALADLMKQNNVTVDEIKAVVGQKGYYPADTPIENYDPQFVNGVLVAAWAQVFSQIQEMRL